jgi:two-component system, response regulator, stage 0 sporulation protein F
MPLLVVDDNDEVRLLLGLKLRAAGWDVAEASSGPQALERLADAHFDLVILDHQMPGMTGLQVAEHLRREQPTLPLVLFSAYLDRTVEESARRLDVHTISKTDLDELEDVVRALIQD